MSEKALAIPEILLHIFSYLEYKELLLCRLVSTGWQRIAEDNSLWPIYITDIGTRIAFVRELHREMKPMGSEGMSRIDRHIIYLPMFVRDPRTGKHMVITTNCIWL